VLPGLIILLLVSGSGALAQSAGKASAGDVRLFLMAAQANRLDILFSMLDRGIDPNVTDTRGNTGLIMAARNRARAAADLLLRRGARAGTANREGWTPLMAAARAKAPEIVRILLARGADARAVEKRFGRTALHVAAQSGEAGAVSLLVGAGSDVNRRDSGSGLTPLMLALGSRAPLRAQAVAELLGAGASVSLKADDGFTPLMAAVKGGDPLLAKLVISGGGDVAARTSYDRSALSIAARAGRLEIVRLLVGKGAALNGRPGIITPLGQAVRSGNASVVKWLLGAGAKPDDPGKAGKTPLILAAGSRMGETVELLLAAGAMVNGTNAGDGTTALMWAANAGDIAIVRRLLRAGARVSIVAKDGWTAIKAAEMAGHENIAELLRRQI